MTVLEAQLENYLVKRVEERGGITAKMTIQGRRGWPDRLVILPGNAIALIELKKPKSGRWSTIQLAMFSRLGHLGVNLGRLNSTEQIDRFLTVLGNKRHLWPAGDGGDYD